MKFSSPSKGKSTSIVERNLFFFQKSKFKAVSLLTPILEKTLWLLSTSKFRPCRFHVELHFSPGVNCCVQKNLPPGPGFRPHSRNHSTTNNSVRKETPRRPRNVYFAPLNQARKVLMSPPWVCLLFAVVSSFFFTFYGFRCFEFFAGPGPCFTKLQVLYLQVNTGHTCEKSLLSLIIFHKFLIAVGRWCN